MPDWAAARGPGHRARIGGLSPGSWHVGPHGVTLFLALSGYLRRMIEIGGTSVADRTWRQPLPVPALGELRRQSDTDAPDQRAR